MDTFLPLVFVCAMMTTNPNHCETIRLPEVTTTLEGCRQRIMVEIEKLTVARPVPFPWLHQEIRILGQCVIAVADERLVRQ